MEPTSRRKSNFFKYLGSVNFESIIQEVYEGVREMDELGQAASYIPELGRMDNASFGVHLTTLDQVKFGTGDYHQKFSIQSIAKVLSLCMAYRILGEDIWSRLGVEPSGTAFNSLIQLETDQGIPRNPFINAGALVIADVLVSHLQQPKLEFKAFINSLSDHNSLDYNPKVAASEKLAGHRNVALCNFIKSFGNIHNDPSTVLDFYFDLCSIEMSCKELSEVFAFLANKGRTITDNSEILSNSQCKRINALMQTCGFYDESGEFAFKVGLPGKSGVGGGIIAILPNHYSIAVWSPGLNAKGNSFKGLKFLEAFTTRTNLSIF